MANQPQERGGLALYVPVTPSCFIENRAKRLADFFDGAAPIALLESQGCKRIGVALCVSIQASDGLPVVI